MGNRDETTVIAGQEPTPETKPGERWLAPDSEDSREMCFEQGKPCIYEPEEELGVIVTEWPNGVVDRYTLATGARIRRWPDGTEDSSAAEGERFPHWPRRES